MHTWNWRLPLKLADVGIVIVLAEVVLAIVPAEVSKEMALAEGCMVMALAELANLIGSRGKPIWEDLNDPVLHISEG